MNAETVSALRRTSQHIDRAAQRIRAVLRRAWSTNNFNAIGKVVLDQGRVLIGAGPESRVIEANAIDQVDYLLTG